MLGGHSLINPTSQDILEIINQNNLSDNLVLGTDGTSLNYTKIISENKTYYMTIDDLKTKLKKSPEQIVLYEDLPAINSGLRGVIIKIDDNNVRNQESLSEIMNNYKPGDKIKIITKDISGDDKILEYEITLAEDPSQKGRAVIGIGFLKQKNARVIGKLFNVFNFFKDPATFYEPKFNAEFIVFIYNLIWWLALINLSVALVNMWPVAIFDGGRMFMLTIWAATGSEKTGKFAFAAITYLILGSLFLLMLGWFLAVF